MTQNIQANIRLFTKQKLAWDYLHDETHSEICYWGGAGWGKSLLGSLWLATEIANKPWSTRAIWRSELKKIKLSTLITFKKMLKDVGFDEDSYKYDDQKSIMTFVNGCMVVLVDLANQPWDPEFDRLGSTEYTGAFIDEAQEIDWKAKQVLSSRIRNLTWQKYFFSRDKKEAEEWIEKNWKWIISYNENLLEYEVVQWITKPKLLMTLNPWRNFIYTDFYKPYKNWTLLDYRAFIQALPTDNPFLTKEYIQILKNLDKVSRERLLYWNFDYSDDPALLFNIDDLWQCFRKVDIKNKELDYYLTIDAARLWKDKTSIWIWKWLFLEKIINIDKWPLTDQSIQIKKIIDKYNIYLENIIVDEVWVGWWLVDLLWCKWFIGNASAIQPYSSKLLPYMKRNYANLRAQSFFYLKQYIEDNKIIIHYDCEFKGVIIEELLFIRQIDIENDSKIRLEAKKDIKDRLWRSPDLADMLSMRMYWVIKNYFNWEDKVEDIEAETIIKHPLEDEIDKLDKIQIVKDKIDIDELWAF